MAKQGLSPKLDSRGDGTGVTSAIGLYADSVVTFSNATNICVLASHGFVTGDGPFQFTTTGTLPAALSLLTDYFVGPTVQSGDFELSLTRGGDAIVLADDGTVTTTIETPFDFYRQTTANIDLTISKLRIFISDLTIAADVDFGAIATGLTNGITIKHVSALNELIKDLLEGATINTNADIFQLFTDVAVKTTTSGNEMLLAEIDFERRNGMPVVIDGDRLEKFVVQVHDDLSGLVELSFIIEGSTQRDV